MGDSTSTDTLPSAEFGRKYRKNERSKKQLRKTTVDLKMEWASKYSPIIPEFTEDQLRKARKDCIHRSNVTETAMKLYGKEDLDEDEWDRLRQLVEGKCSDRQKIKDAQRKKEEKRQKRAEDKKKAELQKQGGAK